MTGMPPNMARGLPSKRVDAYRAGIIAMNRILCHIYSRCGRIADTSATRPRRSFYFFNARSSTSDMFFT